MNELSKYSSAGLKCGKGNKTKEQLSLIISLIFKIFKIFFFVFNEDEKSD